MKFPLHIIGGLVRRTWILALATVAVCAAFAARAVAALQAEEPPLPRAPATLLPRASAPPPSRPARDGTQLVARNMFCSTCDAAPGPAGSPSFTGPAPAVLIATTVGAETKSSRATMRVIASEAQGSWGVGDTVPGVGVVERIGATSVDLAAAPDRRVHLSLLAVAGEPGAATPAAPATAAAAPASPWADRIRALGGNAYEVDRDLVRELVGGSAKTGGARIIPIVEGTDVKGVRFAGVRPDSLPAAIGLKSGDQLAAIDGEPIKSAQQLLDLYAKLDQVSGVELEGRRAGKPLAITLKLR